MKAIKRDFSRTLRKEQTKAERRMWEILRNRKFMGHKFRRQHVIEGFVLDFFCNELKFGLEIDGGIHLRRKGYDQLRQEVIESKGISVMRISNRAILENNNEIIINKLNEFIGSQTIPLPLGEGVKENSIIFNYLGEGLVHPKTGEHK